MTPTGRVLTPELLDELPADDPEAIRSRADLRRIDAIMGNSRWIQRRLVEFPSWASFCELGAGDGRLCRAVAAGWPGGHVVGWDLGPRPPGLDSRIEWREGDFLAAGCSFGTEVCVGALILHHFDSGGLARIGALAGKSRHLLFAEPLRHPLPLLLSKAAGPFIGRVTRHDMPASIMGGFVPGELGAALGLGEGWEINETASRFGALRFEAWRR